MKSQPQAPLLNTYDNNGNTLTKTLANGTTTYTWDFENRLTSVHPPNQTTVTFQYDPFGRRIQKGGSVYLYDAANLIEEADTGGILWRDMFLVLVLTSRWRPIAEQRGSSTRRTAWAQSHRSPRLLQLHRRANSAGVLSANAERGR